MEKRRISLQTHLVLKVLLSAPDNEHYGLEIARRTHLPSGTIYPLLARLENSGWLVGGWEDIDEVAEGRRKRRYYRLTAIGAQDGRRAVETTKKFLFPELTPELAGVT